MARADEYYVRANEAGPDSLESLCNYGQFLVSGGRLVEGRNTLSSVFERLGLENAALVAETIFSLWLCTVMQREDADRFERGFKFLIAKGFGREEWDFDGMLAQAEKRLPLEEFEYARALAMAFLHEEKVADLERFERWNALAAVEPKKLGE
jgi:hypothetical protein